LIESLETRGHRTRWLNDGQEAVAALSGAAPEISPSLLLLDVDLPGLDGLSVLRRLARDDVLSRTRVIMLTARAGEAEVVEALELGAFDHVAKTLQRAGVDAAGPPRTETLMDEGLLLRIVAAEVALVAVALMSLTYALASRRDEKREQVPR